jgi:DNA-binding MarR family transcriptional regulator
VKPFQLDKLFILENLVREILIDNQLVALHDMAPGLYQTFLSAARTEVAQRRNRRLLFGKCNLFADPAWDILLELFVADATESRLSVTAIGLETGVATTTVIRWLTVLENHNLIRRVGDPSDKRRDWVHLTNKGKSIMQKYFKNDRYPCDEIF